MIGPFKKFWQNFVVGDKEGKEKEIQPSILEVTEEPPSPVGRFVLWTIVALLVAGAIWAFVGEVDEVAVANGKVIPVGNVKIVQSENKGTIKELARNRWVSAGSGPALVVRGGGLEPP